MMRKLIEYNLFSETLDNNQFLSWFENRCKNDMTQDEWNILKSNIKEYLI